MRMNVGPFSFRRVESTEALEISLVAFPDASWGWEYGYPDDAALLRPLVSIRIGKLAIFSFEKFKGGFDIRILGFWWIG